MLIFGVISLILASYLMATVVESIIPEIAKAHGGTGTGGLLGTILRFVPVGYAVGLLAIAFSMSVGVGFQSGGSATSRPANLIAAVIVLVIGISMVPVIDAGRDAAENSVSGPCKDAVGTKSAGCQTADERDAYVGSINLGENNTIDDVTGGLPLARSVVGQLAIAKTVVGYLTIGYVVSLLVAAFGLANQASGGRLTGYARSRFNSGMGGM